MCVAVDKFVLSEKNVHHHSVMDAVDFYEGS